MLIQTALPKVGKILADVAVEIMQIPCIAEIVVIGSSQQGNCC